MEGGLEIGGTNRVGGMVTGNRVEAGSGSEGRGGGGGGGGGGGRVRGWLWGGAV